MTRAAIFGTSLILPALALAMTPQNAAAEPLSSRPITIVVPFTPGASADNLQRLVAKKVSDNTGQIFVIESRGGGGGAIGAAAVKQALPDGHTLFQANAGTHAANVALYPSLAYDPVKDFRPITLMWSFPQVLAVPADSPAKSVAELVALAKTQARRPELRLAGHRRQRPPAWRDAEGAHRRADGACALSRRRAGRRRSRRRTGGFLLRRLCVDRCRCCSPARCAPSRSPREQRMPVLPEIPTTAEAGFAGLALDAWFGLVAPAGTPDARDRQAARGIHAGDAQPRHRQGDQRSGRRRAGVRLAGGIRRVHGGGNRKIREGRARGRREGRVIAELKGVAPTRRRRPALAAGDSR